MKLKRCLNLGLVGILTLVMLGTAACGSEDKAEEKEAEAFKPSLDTEADVVINTAGFFGNFEALDQVTNDFNEYYPNVEFAYEQIGINTYEDYIEANPNTDILMTSREIFDKLGDKLSDFYVDLSEAGVDVSDIEEDMLTGCYLDGRLTAIPMGQNEYGLIVNKSLLEKEGLSVPTNYDDFIKALKTLKDKGYTPIQGPEDKVYAELTQSMLYDILLSDEDAYDGLISGDKDVTDKISSVMDRLEEIIDGGYIDSEVNAQYPSDNYDGAILKFFEGDVPFWVCNTEKVSGMKKRETKSEAFQANPFEYEFVYAPLGDKGVYAYQEPWYGFAVNSNGTNRDYAIEFIRFLATRDEINTMAEVKGVPSVAKEKNEVAIYDNILKPEKTEMECVNDGKINAFISESWYTTVNAYARGDFASGREALNNFIELCGAQK